MSEYTTIRRTFIKGDLVITYSNPSLQPFREDKLVNKDNGIMYFYYDIDVLYKGKVLLNSRTHDFPKVKQLGEIIRSLLSEDNYIEEWKTGSKDSFHRIDYYKRIKFEEIFEREYGYVFEAEKCVVKQANETDYKTYKYYYMSITEPNVVMNRWKDESVRTAIRVTMSEEDLLRLKTVAESFMEASIEGYNSYDLPRHLEWLEEHLEYKED